MMLEFHLVFVTPINEMKKLFARGRCTLYSHDDNNMNAQHLSLTLRFDIYNNNLIASSLCRVLSDACKNKSEMD